MMENKYDILSLSLSEIEKIIIEIGEPPEAWSK